MKNFNEKEIQVTKQLNRRKKFQFYAAKTDR